MRNNGNNLGEDPDAHLKPNALKTTDIGDISAILGTAGQVKTNANPKFDFFETIDMYGNFKGAAETIEKTQSVETGKSPEGELRKYVDPVKKDTVTETEANKRQIQREGSKNMSGWTQLQDYEAKK